MTPSSLVARPLCAALLCALGLPSHAQTTLPATSYQYDANGNVTKITDGLGKATTNTYDALDRLVKVTDPANGVTQYGYDALDQLVKVTDPRNLSTTYAVDGLGNQNSLTSPDTGVTKRTFDAAGNVLTSTDAKNQVTTYQYDLLKRVTQITYHDGTTIGYTYDQGANALGRLSRITETGGSIEYRYDIQGRVVMEVRTIGAKSYTTEYQYDSAGRLTKMVYPGGRSVDYVRDAVGRVSQVNTTQNGVTQAVITNVTYQPFGPAQTIVFGNGQADSRSYDTAGRITGYTLNGQAKTLSFDAANRITAIADQATPAINANYGYDLLDRLTSFQQPNGTASISYVYDAVGNRTSQTNGGAVTNYTYATTNNRLTQLSGAKAASIATDANGSITNNGANQFTYDARGRMVSANTSLGQVSYRINALGQRVQKITPNETTVFHYDQSGKLIAENTGTSTTEYIYLGDMPVAVLR